jgi:serine O-acetyltransferase
MHWVFDKEFFNYPRDLLDDSSEYLSSIGEVFLTDIRVKYPGSDISIGPGLFQLLQLDPTIEAIFLYRLSRALFLVNERHELLPYLSTAMRRRTGIELYYSTSIGPGFSIVHGTGVIVGPRYSIGNNFQIYQGVTLGQGRTRSPDEKIKIGDGVILYSGVKVVGDLAIGDNVHVGANAVVNNDLESNAVYAGVPARLIRKLS